MYVHQSKRSRFVLPRTSAKATMDSSSTFMTELMARMAPYAFENRNAQDLAYKIAQSLGKNSSEVADAILHVNGLVVSDSPFARLLARNVAGNLFTLRRDAKSPSAMQSETTGRMYGKRKAVTEMSGDEIMRIYRKRYK